MTVQVQNKRTPYTICRKEALHTSQAELESIRWPSVRETAIAERIFHRCLAQDGYEEALLSETWTGLFDHYLKNAVIEVWRAGRLWERDHTQENQKSP